jgi:hypothetical protein
MKNVLQFVNLTVAVLFMIMGPDFGENSMGIQGFGVGDLRKENT